MSTDPPANPAGTGDPHTDAVQLIDDARESVRWEAARRERRERRTRIAVFFGSLALSLGLAIVAIVVALLSADTRAEDVAARVSADVGAQLIRDAREQRVLTGRAELAKANGRLAARQLPIVPSPPPEASGDALLIQAARANVLADLPEPIIGQLREKFAGQATLPSSLDRIPTDLGDAVVTLLPIVPDGGPPPVGGDTAGGSGSGGSGSGGSGSGSGGSGGGTGSGGGSGGTGGGSAPTGPAPQPPATQAPAPAPGRGLLPLLPGLPIPLPLLSR